jgi:hypothetical protein
MEKYLTPADVVDRVPGTTLGYWAQLRYTGKGPRFVKPSAGKVLYTEAALGEWLASKETVKTGASV